MKHEIPEWDFGEQYGTDILTIIQQADVQWNEIHQQELQSRKENRRVRKEVERKTAPRHPALQPVPIPQAVQVPYPYHHPSTPAPHPFAFPAAQVPPVPHGYFPPPMSYPPPEKDYIHILVQPPDSDSETSDSDIGFLSKESLYRLFFTDLSSTQPNISLNEGVSPAHRERRQTNPRDHPIDVTVSCTHFSPLM